MNQNTVLNLQDCNKMTNDEIPEEQHTNKGRKFWNNGVINKSSHECPGEGFVLGRISLQPAAPSLKDENLELVTPQSVVSGLVGGITPPGLKFFKLNEGATIPKYQTKGSAGFDLHACFDGIATIQAYNLNNKKIDVSVRVNNDGSRQLVMQPGTRYMIPTGLIADIESPNFVMNLYIRSGNALKKGLQLANNVAVIDSDYVGEIFMVTVNTSDVTVIVDNGERVAQGVIHDISQPKISETTIRPQQKTDRDGGFGSTGVK